MNCILHAQAHTPICSANKQRAGAIIPRLLLFASLEYPQQPRHVLQLTALVLILVLCEPPQIFPVCGLVHISGPLWNPCTKTEPVRAHPGPCVQVLFHQVHTPVVIIHAVRTGLLLAPIVQPGAFAAQESSAHLIQIPHPPPTARAEKKRLTSTIAVCFT